MDHFWDGFEKQAGIAHGIGRLFGAVKGAPSAARSKFNVFKTRMKEDFRRGKRGQNSLNQQANIIKARAPTNRNPTAPAPGTAAPTADKPGFSIPKKWRAPAAAGAVGLGTGVALASGGSQSQQGY